MQGTTERHGMKNSSNQRPERGARTQAHGTGTPGTFRRVWTSKLLLDLQLIAGFTLGGWGALGVIVLCGEPVLTRLHIEKLTVSGLTAATVAAAGILTWVYQMASKRLGAVDLFACEISTLCRVFLVVDLAKTTVTNIERLPAAAPGGAAGRSTPGASKQFTSAESYTPVYDNTMADLQPLEADVVTFVTEFYTYRKTMVDYLRRMAAVADDLAAYRACAVQMIFMQFLMYESARKAIERLIEFEASRAESLISIYCSELVAYQFLLKEYAPKHLGKAEDFHHARLELREKGYREDVPRLLEWIAEHEAEEHWLRAVTTAGELKVRYEEVFPEPAAREKNG